MHSCPRIRSAGRADYAVADLDLSVSGWGADMGYDEGDDVHAGEAWAGIVARRHATGADTLCVRRVGHHQVVE